MEPGKKPRRRRSFTPEFKAEIVELCQHGDRSIGQVAKDFDLTEAAVRERIKQRNGTPRRATTGVWPAASVRNWRSCGRRTAGCRRSEILKLALAFFAAEPGRPRWPIRYTLRVSIWHDPVCHSLITARRAAAETRGSPSKASPPPGASVYSGAGRAGHTGKGGSGYERESRLSCRALAPLIASLQSAEGVMPGVGPLDVLACPAWIGALPPLWAIGPVIPRGAKLIASDPGVIPSVVTVAATWAGSGDCGIFPRLTPPPHRPPRQDPEWFAAARVIVRPYPARPFSFLAAGCVVTPSMKETAAARRD